MKKRGTNSIVDWAPIIGLARIVETYAPSIDRVICDAFENVLSRIL